MRKKLIKACIVGSLLTGTIVSLTGCSAMQTAIEHRNLEINTKMSDSIFLEPVPQSKKIIFVDVKNTSGKDLGNIQNDLINLLRQKGYKITQDPSKATFILQVNVLSIEKVKPQELNDILNSGYGDAVSGAIIGGTVAGIASNYNDSTTAGVALASSAASFIAHSLVKDINYVMITDIQIKQKTQHGEKVIQEQDANVQNGSSTNIKQKIVGAKTDWIIYRTRIITVADKVNLDFKEAKPKLIAALERQIAGLF